MSSDKRESLRVELETTRQGFYALADSLSPEDWTKPTPNPAWNVGEMMFHITVAPRFLSEDLRMIRYLGRTLYPPGFIFHRFNKWYTRHGARQYTLATIKQAYDKAHARTLQALDSVGDDEWHKSARYPGWDPMLSGTVTIEQLFHYVSRHFEAHAAEIRQSIRKSP